MCFSAPEYRLTFVGESHGLRMGVNFTVNHVIGTVQDKKLTGADGSGN